MHRDTGLQPELPKDFAENESLNESSKIPVFASLKLVSTSFCRTQPEPLFAEESEEDEEADKEPEWKKRKI